jgi:peptide-methionine (S)-S-oxide reductase
MDTIEKITLGAGCFWCIEAVYAELNGVISVESGFSGGFIKNPAYREVCDGTTGHAEVCHLTFDSSIVSVNEILEVFWKTHDPTTLNRQGNDVGTMYRSAIFYHNEEQRVIAENLKKALDNSGLFKDKIVTEITAFDAFYLADDYHQDYYENNPGQPYCQMVVKPKVDKFRELFADKRKKKESI